MNRKTYVPGQSATIKDVVGSMIPLTVDNIHPFSISERSAIYVIKLAADQPDLWLKVMPVTSRVCFEAAAMKLADRTTVCVPSLLGLRQHSESWYMLTTQLFGRTLADLPDKGDSCEIARLVGAALAKLHSVAFEKCGYYDMKRRALRTYPSYFDYLMLTRTSHPIQTSSLSPKVARLKRVADLRLDRVDAFPNSHNVVVHRDVAPDNVILSPGRSHVCLIDFEYAMVADGLVDLAIAMQFVFKTRDTRTCLLQSYSRNCIWDVELPLTEDLFHCDKFTAIYLVAALNRLSFAVLNRRSDLIQHSVDCMEEVLHG